MHTYAPCKAQRLAHLPACALAAVLSELIPEPKQRSKAWLSTSFPLDSEGAAAAACGPDYHVRARALPGFLTACMHPWRSGTACTCIALWPTLQSGPVEGPAALPVRRCKASSRACCSARRARRSRPTRCCWRWGRMPSCARPCARCAQAPAAGLDGLLRAARMPGRMQARSCALSTALNQALLLGAGSSQPASGDAPPAAGLRSCAAVAGGL